MWGEKGLKTDEELGLFAYWIIVICNILTFDCHKNHSSVECTQRLVPIQTFEHDKWILNNF